jgi:hypothetical protein
MGRFGVTRPCSCFEWLFIREPRVRAGVAPLGTTTPADASRRRDARSWTDAARGVAVSDVCVLSRTRSCSPRSPPHSRLLGASNSGGGAPVHALAPGERHVEYRQNRGGRDPNCPRPARGAHRRRGVWTRPAIGRQLAPRRAAVDREISGIAAGATPGRASPSALRSTWTELVDQLALGPSARTCGVPRVRSPGDERRHRVRVLLEAAVPRCRLLVVM